MMHPHLGDHMLFCPLAVQLSLDSEAAGELDPPYSKLLICCSVQRGASMALFRNVPKYGRYQYIICLKHVATPSKCFYFNDHSNASAAQNSSLRGRADC